MLSPDEVAKVAALARLRLSEGELRSYAAQLGRLVDYVAILGDADTEGVEPMAHAADVRNVFREDEARPSLPREAALANAPKADGRCFLVPQILEGA